MKKRCRSLCFILIIFMLFLGMCLENIKADSFLAYQLVSQTNSMLCSSPNTSLSDQVYTEEKIVKPVGDVIPQIARRNNSKSGWETDLSLLSAEFLWQTFPVTFTLSSYNYTLGVPSHSVIVDYIHQKDGKKTNA